MPQLNSNDALIGHSGFVGTTLKQQRNFKEQYRSTNIHTIRGKSYDTIYCCAAPAKKWLANKEPEADIANIESLIEHLGHVKCERFVLISTVDVFLNPVSVNEETPVMEDGLHAYGLHRRRLEQFVISHFENHSIIRLPGLVGPGLQKNFIFDLLNDNNVHLFDEDDIFQFYPMVNLWSDIKRSFDIDKTIFHFATEPISVGTIANDGFGLDFNQKLDTRKPVFYDMHTSLAKEFGGSGNYMYSQKETLIAIRAYAQTEDRK